MVVLGRLKKNNPGMSPDLIGETQAPFYCSGFRFGMGLTDEFGGGSSDLSDLWLTLI